MAVSRLSTMHTTLLTHYCHDKQCRALDGEPQLEPSRAIFSSGGIVLHRIECAPLSQAGGCQLSVKSSLSRSGGMFVLTSTPVILLFCCRDVTDGSIHQQLGEVSTLVLPPSVFRAFRAWSISLRSPPHDKLDLHLV